MKAKVVSQSVGVHVGRGPSKHVYLPKRGLAEKVWEALH